MIKTHNDNLETRWFSLLFICRLHVSSIVLSNFCFVLHESHSREKCWRYVACYKRQFSHRYIHVYHKNSLLVLRTADTYGTAQWRTIETIGYIGFREPRDAAETFINWEWIADKIHGTTRFASQINQDKNKIVKKIIH